MKTLYKGEHAGEYSQVLAPTPDKITKLGMARTFQNIRLWKSQTVFDNVLIAKHCRSSSNFLSAAFRLNRAEEARQREEVEQLLKTVGLMEVKDELATSLPTASSAAWRLPGPWLRSRSCCCWTNPRRA